MKQFLSLIPLRAACGAVLGLLFAALAPAAEWGDLTGRFVFDGPVPKAVKVDVNKDQEVFGKLNLIDESLVVGDDGGIKNVVIYVRSVDVPVHPDLEKSLPPKVVYDNKGGHFVPHILTLWLDKQTIVLNNSDPVGHNSNLQPLGDEGINPLLPPGGMVEYRFNRKQTIPVPVGCNIHPWMKGYILPRDNPYATVSEKDGTFKLANLPAGELEFQAWHEKAGYLATPQWDKGRFKLTIKPGANSLGDVKVPAALFNK